MTLEKPARILRHPAKRSPQCSCRANPIRIVGGMQRLFQLIFRDRLFIDRDAQAGFLGNRQDAIDGSDIRFDEAVRDSIPPKDLETFKQVAQTILELINSKKIYKTEKIS